jgi:rare lipoprotein A (peptidoglycan hydrolase)
MKRRVSLTLGLASVLMLLQPQSGRGSPADVPPGEAAEPAGPGESAESSQSDTPVKRGAAKLLKALSPEKWKEQPKQKQRGLSSWYGKQFHGKTTASGEPFDMHAMTAAHRTLPLQTYVRVTNLANGKIVVVRINDRGPRLHSRIIDLSHGAAKALGFSKKGLARVEVEVLPPDEVARLVKK